MELVDFKKEHYLQILAQPAQQGLSQYLDKSILHSLEGGLSYTALCDGKPIGCAGIINFWNGRGAAWAFLDETCGEHFIFVHKAVKRALESCYIKRVEATVDCEFEQGHRWMKMLGFKLEAQRMIAYRPDGGDCSLYARIT